MQSNETAAHPLPTAAQAPGAGAERSAADLLEKLIRSRIVVVTGTSGSGKSTFIRKTFWNYLQAKKPEGLAGRTWRRVVTMPYEDPIGNLAADLCRADDEGNGLFRRGSIKPPNQEDLQRQLREKNAALSQIYEQALIANGEDDVNLLLVIDQKQELYRYQQLYREKGDDVRFINLLLNAANSNLPIYIVFITDSRYFEHFSKYRGLPEVMNNNQFRMLPVAETEIRAFLNRKLDRLAEANALHWKDRDAFVDFAADAYLKLLRNEDAAALQKMNLWFQEVLRHAARTIPDDGYALGAAAQAAGPVSESIDNFMERKFSELGATERQLCPFLFKTLTGKGGDNQYSRRPVHFGELIRIKDRHPDWNSINYQKIREILDHFNQNTTLFGAIFTEQFIRISGGLVADERTIADIDSDGLLTNWARLGDWIENESGHAGLYRNLVRDAVNYYAAPAVTPIKAAAPASAPHDEGVWKKMLNQTTRSFHRMFGEAADTAPATDLYERAMLFSVNKWERECLPNANWSLRYAPGLYFSKEQLDRLRTKFPGKKFSQENSSDPSIYLDYYDLAVNHFLKESKQKFDDELSVKESQILTATRQRRKTRLLAILAGVAFLVSVFFAGWAYYERNNMLLIDFVEVLNANGALDIERSHTFRTMRKLVDHVVHDTGIRTRDDVIGYLASDDAGVLRLDPGYRELSVRALKNMGDFFASRKSYLKIMGNRDSLSLRREIDAIYADAMEAQQSGFRQFPAVYYAMRAQGMLNLLPQKEPLKTEIYKTALVAGPAVAGQDGNPAYTFGDIKGMIYIRRHDDQGVRTWNLDTQRGAIYTLSCCDDGSGLLIGFENGDILKYRHIDSLLLGIPYNYDAWTETLYQPGAGAGASVYYFLGEWDASNLLVRTSDALFFLKKQGDRWIATPRIPTSDKMMGYVDWTPDRRWLLAAGRDASQLYRLDPDQTQPIVSAGRILHDNTTIVEVDIAADASRLQIAMGSEEGDIWIWDGVSGILEGTSSLDTDFKKLEKVHESAITALEFNPTLPQLASASREGMLQLWNLRPELLNAGSDHIVLRNRLSILDIEYLNGDKLIVYEDLTGWIMDAHIESLKQTLDCQCDQH